MSASTRHVEMVRAICASLDAAPITLDDLPPLSGERLDQARAAAGGALEAAELEHRAITEELESLRAEREELVATLERCDGALEQIEVQVTAGEAAVAETEARIAQIDDETAGLDVELASATATSDALYTLRQQVDRVLEAATMPLTEERLAAFLADAEDLAARLGETASSDSAHVVETWIAQLREGDASLAAPACELLSELEQIQQELDEFGGGDAASDPAVMDARAEVLSCQSTLSELEAQAETGVLGERARSAIETAHARRLAVENQGRKADRGELEAARAAEDEALSHVGFDSMLDFRIVMSSTGVGTLAGKRREVAATRLEQAKADLEQALETSRTRREAAAARRDGIRRRAAALVGVTDGDEAIEVLSCWYETPEGVERLRQDLAQQAQELQREIAQQRDQVAGLEAQRSEAANLLEEQRHSIEATHAQRPELESERDAARAGLGTADERAPELERRRGRAQVSLGAAREEVSRVSGVRYLDSDVGNRRTALVQLIRERAAEVVAATPARADSDETTADETAGADEETTESDVESDVESDAEVEPALVEGPRGVVLDDPLMDLDRDDALSVLSALMGIDWGVDVVLVTSRKELLTRASRHGGSIRSVDGRRRVPRTRFGRRAKGLLEPAAR